MKSIIVAVVSTTALIGAAFAQNTQGGAQPQTNEGVQSKKPEHNGIGASRHSQAFRSDTIVDTDQP